MRVSLPKILAVLLIVMSWSRGTSAATIQVGVFSFDTGTLAGDIFSITNLTGPNALPPDFPVEPLLTFTVTNLSASLLGGGTLTVDGSKFTTDGSGNVNCLEPGDAGTGDCNFAAYDLLSATISGILSPTSGLTGLPPGFVGLESAVLATLTPGCGRLLTAGCDAVVIEATLVPETPTQVPEPSTGILLQLGMGALAVYKLQRKSHILNRLRRRRH
jgi:hypothetical protein